MLALYCFVSFVYCMPYWWDPNLFYRINIVLPITDLTIQLFICYICVTLGASEFLNRFDCYLIENGHGGYELRFVLK